MNSKNLTNEENTFNNTTSNELLPQNQLEESDKKPRVIEKRVVEYRNRRGGCLGTGIGCGGIGCLFMLLILSCCVGIIFVIINRPAFIWDRVIYYLNQDVVLPQYEPINAGYVEQSILGSLKGGQNDIYITEEQLTAIARDKLPQFNDLRFDLESNVLTMYWALDQSNNPVYGEVKMIVENNVIRIDKVGTPGITLPEFTNDTLNNLILSVMSINNKNGGENLINTLLADNANLKVNRIEFQKDRVYLDINLDINIF